jgi:hypothetical protein
MYRCWCGVADSRERISPKLVGKRSRAEQKDGAPPIELESLSASRVPRPDFHALQDFDYRLTMNVDSKPSGS